MARPPKCEVLGGFWSDYTYGILDGRIKQARRLEYPDGRMEFVVDGVAESTTWSLHLRRHGDEYVGTYCYSGEKDGYPVAMKLYRAVDEDGWLLLGTWKNPQVETTQWAISLSSAESDEE